MICRAVRLARQTSSRSSSSLVALRARNGAASESIRTRSARGQPRVLGDVLDPQVQRAGEAPAHRQVRGLAQRRQRLARVQRVDQDEVRPQVAWRSRRPGRPGRPGPRGPRTGGSAPSRAGPRSPRSAPAAREPQVLLSDSRLRLPRPVPQPRARPATGSPATGPATGPRPRHGGAGPVREGRGRRTQVRRLAQRVQDGVERPLAHLDLPPAPVPVAGGHPVGRGPPSGLVARHPQ